MSKRITERDLRDMANPEGISGPSPDSPFFGMPCAYILPNERELRLIAEVRRLWGLIAEWHATYAHDSNDLMTVPEEVALLAEGDAICKEKSTT